MPRTIDPVIPLSGEAVRGTPAAAETAKDLNERLRSAPAELPAEPSSARGSTGDGQAKGVLWSARRSLRLFRRRVIRYASRVIGGG